MNGIRVATYPGGLPRGRSTSGGCRNGQEFGDLTMAPNTLAAGTLFGAGLLGLAGAVAAPAPVTPDEVAKDRAGFIPTHNPRPLPGQAVGVLAGNARQVMGLEGRSGPPDALAFRRGGASYRWVYVPAEGRPLITGLDVPVGDRGQKKRYPEL